MQQLKSFIIIPEGSDFTLQNIPFGSVCTQNSQPFPATIIGTSVINLQQLELLGYFSQSQLLTALGHKIFDTTNLDKFIRLTRPYWKEVRQIIQSTFSSESALQTNQEHLKLIVIPEDQTKNVMPVSIGEYTDFYSSKNHAYNMGCMIRGPENAMQANWYHLPVGYHGRRSSVVVDGTEIRRPWGQVKPPTAEKPSFTQCKRLDFELEVGAFMGGPANKLGEPIKVNQAEDRVFGFVLLNDWSARDIQVWEYVPLGPFNAKNFASTISPWIVTIEALEPFRVELPKQDPEPFEYLREQRHTSFDIKLEAYLQLAGSQELEHFTTSNFKYMYWSVSQQIAHHSITGCNIGPGDLFGSGTISGLTKEERGSIMELTWNGKEPLQFKNGASRLFIEDGDMLEMRGFNGEGLNKVGFGRCRGKILPAVDEQYFKQ